MSDLTERLRAHGIPGTTDGLLMDKAADRIDKLEPWREECVKQAVRIEELEAELRDLNVVAHNIKAGDG